MLERVVLCGDQEHKTRARGERLYLRLTGDALRHTDDDSNVSLRLGDISRKLLAEVPDLLADLLEIAAYVLAADATVSRGGSTLANMGDEWRRRFRFIIPVKRAALWASPELTELLVETLSFLSEDDYQFEFVEQRAPVPFSSYFPLDAPDPDKQPADEVVLFSGGLDSLAGAVDELLGAKKRVVLVSHHSSTKLAGRQRDLAGALSQRVPDRVLHVPVRMYKRSDLTVEYSQRSRSFFFVALGAVVARMLGTNRIRLFENGIISVNLPIAENVVGARATRSTHPTVIAGLNRLLAGLLDPPISVDNPYNALTKAEVVRRIARHGCADLIPQTVSCSRVYQIKTERPHCGECTQCLGRRFAILGADLAQHDPEGRYRVRLFTDGRPDAARRVLAVSFIELARQLARMSASEFLARFGLELTRAIGDMPGDREDHLRQLFELHQRHGTSVTEALAEAFRRHANELAEGKLPDTCLVRLAAAPDAMPDQAGQAERGEPRAPWEKGETSIETDGLFSPDNIMLALDRESQQVLIEGLGVFSSHKVFPFFECLVDLREDDMAQKRRDDNYAFMTPETLANELRFDDGALRALIYRTRRGIREAAEKVAPALSRNDVIEGKRSTGYRLGRAVRVVALSEIRR